MELRLHPAVALFFCILFILVSLATSHPIYLVAYLIFLVVLLRLLDKEKNYKKMVVYLVRMGIMIILINPIVSQSGRTVLFQLRHLPVIGTFKITLEAIVYGVCMAIKLADVSLTFTLFGLLTDQDDVFSFASRYASKSTILFSMTVNMIQRLKQDVERIREVFTTRGVAFQQKSIVERTRAMYPLIKVVVISSMEGALDRAEALHARGFVGGRRTTYKRIAFDGDDIGCAVMTSVFALSSIVALTGAASDYKYYPRLDRLFDGLDIWFIAVMLSLACVLGYFLKVVWIYERD